MPIKRKPKVEELPVMGEARFESAPITTDYIRQYVGALTSLPTPQSAVYLNKDRVFLTQQYQDLAQWDLYDEVERDPHIAAVMNTRRLQVAGLEWTINPATRYERVGGKKQPVVEGRDVDIADVIYDKLTHLNGFTQDMVQLLDAIGKGFSVSEIIWDVDKEGFVVPVDIRNRPQRRFQFDAETMKPKVRTMQNPFYGDPLPERKFIVHRNYSKYESPFGDPLDQQIYWMWLFKRNFWKLWMTHGETSASPLPFAVIPTNASAQLKSMAFNVIQQMRSGSSGYIPDNIKIMWSEASNIANSADTFENGVRMMDDQITKCVLGQMLTTEGSSSTGAGSRALGDVHQGVRRDILEYDAKALSETISGTLVKWMVDYNFENVLHYPRFEFMLEAQSDIERQSRVIMNLASAGYMVAKTYIEDGLQIPIEKVLEPKQTQVKL